MADIFEEVDEELRNDDYQKYFRRYGPWIGAVAAIVVMATAGYQILSYWNTSKLESSSDSFIASQASFDADQLALAAAGFETLAEDGTAGYSTLALLQRAAVALEAGENETAAQFFDQAAASSGDPLIQDLAGLKSVWARWDSLSFSDVEIRLTPLSGQSSPYAFLARETVAAAALRAGDYERARQDYQFLTFALDAPQGVQQRASEAIAFLDQVDSNDNAEIVIDDVEAEDVSVEPTRIEDAEETGND